MLAPPALAAGSQEDLARAAGAMGPRALGTCPGLIRDDHEPPRFSQGSPP